MKIWSVLWKTLLVQVRDYWVLVVSLISAPFFVFIYWAMDSGMTPVYKVGLLGAAARGNPAIGAVEALIRDNATRVQTASGVQLELLVLQPGTPFEERILNRDIDLLMTLVGQDSTIAAPASPKSPNSLAVRFVGDASNARYPVAAVLAYSLADEAIRDFTGLQPAFQFEEVFLGGSSQLKEFDLYIPGLLVFSIVMVLFTLAMAIIRDVEEGTLIRLRLSGLSVWEYLAGIGLAQVILAVLSIGLTFATAVGLGFNPPGSLAAAWLVCALCILAMVGVGFVTVAFCKNSHMVLTFGTIPLFILMFFSGAMLPFSVPALFIIQGKELGWNALLPPTPAVGALNKILIHGAAPGDLWFEWIWLGILAVLYILAGAWLIARTHFRNS